MVVSFDALDRMETPNLTLCNPGSVYNSGAPTKTVGVLTDHEAEEITFNFNSLSELSFRINKVQHDNETNASIQALYKGIQNRRLIFVDGIGYFIIKNVSESYSNGMWCKDVTCESIDSEIQQKNIPYIEDNTYTFSTLLTKVTSVIPGWTVDHVDSTTSALSRTFEDVDTSLNCYGFMMENMQDAYECIFLFDITNRKINVYDQSTYAQQAGVRTSIHLTCEDIVNEITINEDSSNIYTAITVKGGSDDVTISSVNPLGGNTMYRFDYYLDWMSAGLRNKVTSWQNAIETQASKTGSTSYYKKNLAYYGKLEEISGYNSEISRYKILIEKYKECRNNAQSIFKNGGDSEGIDKLKYSVTEYNEYILELDGEKITVTDDVEELIDSIDEIISDYQNAKSGAESDLNTATAEANSLKAQINNIISSLDISTYFGADYSELQTFIFEGNYTDEYIIFTDSMTKNEKFTQMRTLYDRAKNQLLKISNPTQEFSISTESFIFDKAFKDWSDQIETGSIVNVEIEEGDVAELFLSTISVNWDDKEMSLTFGNRYNKYDPKSLFNDYLGKISKASNSINHINEVLSPLTEISTITYTDKLVVVDNTATITYDAIGTSGAEISAVYIINSQDGTIGMRLTQGAAASQGYFTYNPTTKTLTFSGLSNGTNIIAYYKRQVNSYSQAMSTIESSRELSLKNVLYSNNEEIIIDEHGYTGRSKNNSGGFDDEQIKITSRNIVFTRDGWDTCEMAIGKIGEISEGGETRTVYGINADAILAGKIQSLNGNTNFDLNNAQLYTKHIGTSTDIVDDMPIESGPVTYTSLDSETIIGDGKLNIKTYKGGISDANLVTELKTDKAKILLETTDPFIIPPNMVPANWESLTTQQKMFYKTLLYSSGANTNAGVYVKYDIDEGSTINTSMSALGFSASSLSYDTLGAETGSIANIHSDGIELKGVIEGSEQSSTSMSCLEINTPEITVSGISDSPMADYIIEYGSPSESSMGNGWYYRKWASGYVELVYDKTGISYTQDGIHTYSQSYTLSLPFKVYNGNLTGTFSNQFYLYQFTRGNATAASPTIQYRINRPAGWEAYASGQHTYLKMTGAWKQ